MAQVIENNYDLLFGDLISPKIHFLYPTHSNIIILTVIVVAMIT